MIENYNNPLPGVPNVESPFFSRLFDASDEHYNIAKQLNESGFAVADFPDPEIMEVAERLKSELTDLYPWDKWFDTGADMRIMDLWESNANVKRIATNEKVRQILRYLYGREAFPFQTLNFPVGTEQHFHTDSVHFSARPERFMCGVWVALEDIGLEQGPLVYYPGSHKWPIYTREHIGLTYKESTGNHQRVFEPMWDQLVEAHGVQPKRFLPRKGQMLIWAANLLHGGDRQNNRNLTRWSQVTHYYFDDCSYYSPLGSNEPFGEIQHRKPTNIASGEEIACFYNGREVSPDYIERTMPSSREPEPVFDGERYLELNPDVASAGVDPWAHFNAFGRKEGRRYR